MKYLGIDYGTKRVGLALSDESGSIGFPHAIVPNTPRLASDLCALIAKENVGAVVIGESRNFAGGQNAVAKAARALSALIADQAGVPVFFEDETMTSAEARRKLAPTSSGKVRKSRAPAKSAHVDSSAAALILTSYLSHTHGA